MRAALERFDLAIKGVRGGVRTWGIGAAGPGMRELVLLIAIGGVAYGLFMGSWELGPGRYAMLAYAALKVPLMIGVTTCVCLPGFWVLNAALGLANDLPKALRAVLASQAGFAIALMSLGPVTRFVYACGVEHRVAILANGVMFALATGVAQGVLWSRYRELIRSDARHAAMLWAWVTLYVFVGIQMGWMLRPFVGAPGMEVAFFREEPFTNAYVEVFRIVTSSNR